MGEIPKCKHCGSATVLEQVPGPLVRMRCADSSCWHGPAYTFEQEAVASWAALMRDAGPTVKWTTRPPSGEVMSNDNYVILELPDDLELPLQPNRFGDLAPFVSSKRCTLTITAVPTEAEPEPPKPAWCKDNDEGNYDKARRDCARDETATRDDCDGCEYYVAYYVADDDISPIPPDLARLYKLSTDLATLRADVVGRLNKLESPEPAEPADSVEPDEPKTRTVILRHRNGCECGNHKIETGYAPDGFVLDGVTYAIDPTRPNTYRATYLPPAHRGEVLIRKGLDGD